MDENGNIREDQMPFTVRVKTAWENFRRRFRIQDCFKRPARPCFPMSPTEMIMHYGKNLSGVEIAEILDFPKIWYFNQSATNPCSHSHNNFMFGDHIGYRYEVLRCLGHGTYGQVFKCLDHKTCEMVAVKVTNPDCYSIEEAKILELLRKKDGDNSHNVIHMKECFYFREKLCIVLELMGLDLFEFMCSDAFEPFNATFVKQIARDLLKGLTLLEQEKLIHSDLKPDNITFAKDNRVKLIDFGCSFFQNSSIFSNIQALWYRSPEVILMKPYSSTIDMWSLGCVLVEIYTGEPLFPGEDVPDQLACIMEVLGIPPDDLFWDSPKKTQFFNSNGQPRVFSARRERIRKPGSKDLASILQTDDEQFLDFIKRCLTWDAKDRLTASEATKHDWLNQDNFTNVVEMQEEQSDAISECFVETFHMDSDDSEMMDFCDDSETMDLNDDSETMDLNDDSKKMDLNDDSKKMDLNDDSKKMDLSDDSKKMDLNDDSKKMDLNDDSKKMDLNDDSKKMDLSDDSKKMDLNDDSKKMDLNNDSKKMDLNDDSKKMDLNDDSKKMDLNDDSKKMDLNDDSKKMDLNNDSKKMDLNNDSKKMDLNNDSETIDIDQEIEDAAEQAQAETSVERCSSKQGVFRRFLKMLCLK